MSIHGLRKVIVQMESRFSSKWDLIRAANALRVPAVPQSTTNQQS